MLKTGSESALCVRLHFVRSMSMNTIHSLMDMDGQNREMKERERGSEKSSEEEEEKTSVIQ